MNRFSICTNWNAIKDQKGDDGTDSGWNPDFTDKTLFSKNSIVSTADVIKRVSSSTVFASSERIDF